MSEKRLQRESLGRTLTEFGKDTWNLIRPEQEEEKEKEPDLIKDTLDKRISELVRSKRVYWPPA